MLFCVRYLDFEYAVKRRGLRFSPTTTTSTTTSTTTTTTTTLPTTTNDEPPIRFDAKLMRGANAKVPIQHNAVDCGVYLLMVCCSSSVCVVLLIFVVFVQFAERVAREQITSFASTSTTTTPERFFDRPDWFAPRDVRALRTRLRALIDEVRVGFDAVVSRVND